MALNPPLNDTGEPLRIEGEHFVMQRKGIEFEIKVDGLGKFKGEGLVSSLIKYKTNKINDLNALMMHWYPLLILGYDLIYHPESIYLSEICI